MIIHADTYEWTKTQPDSSVDSVITDYVYGTEFPIDLFRICKGNIITFCSEKDHPFDPTERAYWIKQPSTKNTKGSKKLSRFVEHIFIYRQGDTFNTDLHWSNYTGVYMDMVDGSSNHPWEKPLSLLERLVRIYTKPEDLVLDPFCGSGRVLQACMSTRRRPIGIDIDEQWVNYCKELGL